MRPHPRARCLRWLCMAWLTVLLHGHVLALVPADAPLLWSQPANRADCPDASGYLWLPQPEGASAPSCLRYFGPTQLQGARTVIAYFTGDRDQSLRLTPAQIPGNTAQAQEARMQQLSRQAGLPVLMLARPGTYGSSGDHRLRRRMAQEFAPLSAGLDLLRQRYGIAEWVLWGHSGGATAAAALLTMGRRDVRCAVLSSATFDYVQRWRMQREQDIAAPSQQRGLALAQVMYDPLAHVDGVVQDPRRSVHVLGDPRDTVTPFVLQTAFAQALQRAGHHAAVHEEEAVGPEFHNLKRNAGLRRAAACAHDGARDSAR